MTSFDTKLTAALLMLEEELDDAHCQVAIDLTKQMVDDVFHYVQDILQKDKGHHGTDLRRFSYDPVVINSSTRGTNKVPVSLILRHHDEIDDRSPYAIAGAHGYEDEDLDSYTKPAIELEVHIHDKYLHSHWPKLKNVHDGWYPDIAEELYFALEHEITHNQSSQKQGESYFLPTDPGVHPEDDDEDYDAKREAAFRLYMQQGREWQSNLHAILRFHRYVRPLETIQDVMAILNRIGSASMVHAHFKDPDFRKRVMKALAKRGIVLKDASLAGA